LEGLLFDDFHDIFPGSGIAVNYLDAKRNLEDVGRVGEKILDASLEEIAANVNLKGSGVPVVVFKPRHTRFNNSRTRRALRSAEST